VRRARYVRDCTWNALDGDTRDLPAKFAEAFVAGAEALPDRRHYIVVNNVGGGLDRPNLDLGFPDL
jgi:hypothetical protein